MSFRYLFLQYHYSENSEILLSDTNTFALFRSRLCAKLITFFRRCCIRHSTLNKKGPARKAPLLMAGQVVRRINVNRWQCVLPVHLRALGGYPCVSTVVPARGVQGSVFARKHDGEHARR